MVLTPSQGGMKIKKKDLGSISFELTPVLGLTKYVSGHLSIYGNSIPYLDDGFFFWFWIPFIYLQALNSMPTARLAHFVRDPPFGTSSELVGGCAPKPPLSFLGYVS